MSMIRSVVLLAFAGLVFALFAPAAQAQVSTAELLTRIDRLEAALRELTGTVEQLQFHNRELEQEVQRLQAAAPPAGPQYAPPPAAPYSPSPDQASAAQPSIAAPEPVPVPGRRGDSFDPGRNPNAPGAPRTLGTSTAATEPPPPVSDAPMAAPGPCDRL
jgi:hypothetical protein